jgi:hypothetical protein
MFCAFVPGLRTVQLEFVGLRFLLLVLGWRPLWLFVGRLFMNNGMSEALSSLYCSLSVKGARLALGARVCKGIAISLFAIVGVKAVDMLPCIACLAVDRVSVIVREVADTLDGVRLLFHRLRLVQ